MLIRAESKYSKNTLIRFAKFNAFKTKKQIFIYVLLEIIMAALSGTLIFTSDNSLELYLSIYLFTPVLLMLIPMMLFLLPAFMSKVSYKFWDSIYKIEFTDEEINIEKQSVSSTEKIKANYLHFDKVYETANEFYLYFSMTEGYIIKKTEIVEGSVSDLRELLKSKIASNRYFKTKNRYNLIKRIRIVSIIAFIVFCILGNKYRMNLEHDKVFSGNGISITLTDKFHESENISYSKVLKTNKIAVFETKQTFEKMKSSTLSLEEYAQKVIDTHKINSGIEVSDGFTSFTYESNTNGVITKIYAVVLKSNDSYWLVQFGCNEANYNELKPTLVKYAKSIQFS